MIIALDFDNALCDSMQVWHNIMARTFPERRPIPLIRELDDWNLEERWGLNDSEKEVIFNIFRRKAIKYASPMDSNFYVWIEKLIADGHRVFVLTSNPSWMQENIRYWLSEFGLDLNIVCTESIEEKRKHKFDVLVDDSPQAYNMIDWEEEDKTLLVYHQPWNKSFELTNNIYRVYNFRDIYKAIKFLETR